MSENKAKRIESEITTIYIALFFSTLVDLILLILIKSGL